MDNCVIINNIERVDHLHSLVAQDLRDLGIKVPKPKKLRKLNQSRAGSQNEFTNTKVFGENLNTIPAKFLPDYGYVPSFLLEAAQIIDEHLDSEGIFRKSGSCNRQKELRAAVDAGHSLQCGSNIYDLANLMKQFFRDLPEPVVVVHLQDAFIKSYTLSSDKSADSSVTKALLRMCLLLPTENIGALRFILHLLNRVVNRSDQNKMTAHNLSVVMAPNLMHSKNGHTLKMTVNEEKALNMKTCVIELLIRNCKLVGMVDVNLQNQLRLMSECFNTDDDLDASDDNTLEESAVKEPVMVKKKRKRSNSLTGLVSSIKGGFAKLRRSTDGKSFNHGHNNNITMTSASATNLSQIQTEMTVSTACSQPDTVLPVLSSQATPHIRKRRASGDAVPFSASKKKAILGALPQRSALASTPFTPASQIKRPHYLDESSFLDVSGVRMNATTPISGSKACRKKINLFPTPHSTKKSKLIRKWRLSPSRPPDPSAMSSHLATNPTTVNQSNNHSRGLSPLNKRGLQFFRRLSGERKTVPVPASVDQSITRSSPSLYEEVKLVTHNPGDIASLGMRSWSEEALQGRLSQSHRPVLDKGSISAPSPIIVPVVSQLPEVKVDGEMRRSRRDEYEREKNMRNSGKKLAASSAPELSESNSSDSNRSLLMAIIPPPQGFGDVSMEEEKIKLTTEDQDMMVDIESETMMADDGSDDQESCAGFSTISGGTVIHRRDPAVSSSNLVHSASGTSLTSSASDPGYAILSQCKDMDIEGRLNSFLDHSQSLQDVSMRAPVLDMQQRRRGDRNEAMPATSQSDTAVRHQEVDEGTYVVLRRPAVPDMNTDNRRASAMKLLSDNYASEEDSSGGAYSHHRGNHINITNGEMDEGLQNMPSRTNVNRKKSLSAQHLEPGPTYNTPTRANSTQQMFLSPGKKFNYKPSLQISRDTHKLLSRAGFMAPQSEARETREDVPVPVRSPKRSAHREEMMHSLRASFHEKRRSFSTTGSSRNYSSMRVASSTRLPKGNDTVSLDRSSFVSSSDFDMSSVSSSSVPTLTLNDKVEELSSKMEISKSCENEDEDLKSVDGCGGGDKDTSEKALPYFKDEEDDICNNEDVNVGTVNSKNSEVEKISVSKSEVIPVLAVHNKKIGESRNQALTLSKILDNELSDFGPVKIKRAQISLPRHESIRNIQEVKAGSVKQSVKQFNRHKAPIPSGLPQAPPHKRGNSPIRIPTIFAKTDEKVRQYREIASFARERLQASQRRSGSPSNEATGASGSDSDMDSDGSVGNVTIKDVVRSPSQGEDSPDSGVSVSTLASVTSVTRKDMLSESLVETIKELKTMSPLHESTNTTDRLSGSLKKPRSLAGHTPRRVQVPSSSKRGRGSTPPRKPTAGTNGTLSFASVWAAFDDDKDQAS